MQKVYAGTKLTESELAFLRANYPDTYQSVVEKEKTGQIHTTAYGAAKAEMHALAQMQSASDAVSLDVRA